MERPVPELQPVPGGVRAQVPVGADGRETTVRGALGQEGELHGPIQCLRTHQGLSLGRGPGQSGGHLQFPVPPPPPWMSTGPPHLLWGLPTPPLLPLGLAGAWGCCVIRLGAGARGTRASRLWLTGWDLLPLCGETPRITLGSLGLKAAASMFSTRLKYGLLAGGSERCFNS